MNKRLRTIKAAYTILFIAAVIIAFKSISFAEMTALIKKITISQLCYIALMLCAMTMISAGFWRRLLRLCTEKNVDWLEVFGQHAMMSLGKYLPSGVIGILGRHHLLTKLGVSGSKSIELFLNEQALTILSGIFASAFFMLIGLGLNNALLSFVAVFSLCGCLLFPYLLAQCKKAAPKIAHEKFAFILRLKLAPGFYSSFACALLAWLAQSLLFLLLLMFIISPELEVQEWVMLMGIQCLSVLLGLLAIFAPAGIGVREAVLIAIGTAVLPRNELLVIAVVHRLVLMFWDFAVGLLGSLLQILKREETKSDSL